MRVRCLVDKGWPMFNPTYPDKKPALVLHEEGVFEDTDEDVKAAVESGYLEVLGEDKKEDKEQETPEKGEEE